MSSDELNTRDRILKSAYELIEAGAGTRMSDIAKRTGITRQALYLHFRTRGELLVATTHYVDELKESESRLAKSRSAKSGEERLDAYVEAWTAYIPEIYSVAKVMLSLKDSDADVGAAWKIRMLDMKEGCEAAIMALERDGRLKPSISPGEATDMLWMILSVQNWEKLTLECGWSQEKYVESIKAMTKEFLLSTKSRDRK